MIVIDALLCVRASNIWIIQKQDTCIFAQDSLIINTRKLRASQIKKAIIIALFPGSKYAEMDRVHRLSCARPFRFTLNWNPVTKRAVHIFHKTNFWLLAFSPTVKYLLDSSHFRNMLLSYMYICVCFTLRSWLHKI